MAGLRLCSDGIVCNGLWQACDSGSIYVCASTASITQQSVNRTTNQPASQGGRQAAGRVQTGWSSRLVSRMNHSGSANRPQPDHITATQHPAIYRAAYGCVQGGRGRRREGKAAKKKTESHIKKTQRKKSDGRKDRCDGSVKGWRKKSGAGRAGVRVREEGQQEES